MTIKEAMHRLSLSFKYEEFQKALSQKPIDVKRLQKAIIAMDQREEELLLPVFRELTRHNLPPSSNRETVKKFSKESLLMKGVRDAIIRWRKEFLPDWQRLVEFAEEKARQNGAQS